MGRQARTLGVATGAWLLLSTFLWEHTRVQLVNGRIAAVLCMACAAAAFAVPTFRWALTVLAIWLFLSVFALPGVGTATGWSVGLSAIVLFLSSLVPSDPIVGTRPRLVRVR